MRESALEEGDHVLVRNLCLRNKHKLADKWESTIYRALKRMGDSPVYMVQPIDGSTRTLHRDHLLPCGYLSEEEEEPSELEPVSRRPRTKQSSQLHSDEFSNSDDEDTYTPLQSSVVPEQRFTKVYKIPVSGGTAFITSVENQTCSNQSYSPVLINLLSTKDVQNIHNEVLDGKCDNIPEEPRKESPEQSSHNKDILVVANEDE